MNNQVWFRRCYRLYKYT